jgi:hypothetical protein
MGGAKRPKHIRCAGGAKALRNAGGDEFRKSQVVVRTRADIQNPALEVSNQNRFELEDTNLRRLAEKFVSDEMRPAQENARPQRQLRFLLAPLGGFHARRFCVPAGKTFRRLMGLLRELESLGCIFQRLSRVLVPGLVVFLAVMRGSDAVSVRGKVMELRRSLVPVIAA